MPYTIAPYIVRGFQEASSVDSEQLEAGIGWRTGLLAATFCGAQFLTSFPLGLMSDRVGRKPMMVLSHASGAATIVAFGLAGNYLAAIGSRFIGGALNFTGGLVRVMLAEVCTGDELTRAMAAQGIAWGFGTLVGPAIGGITATPCQTFGSSFPLCEEGALFQRRPYLLPCLCAASLGVVATLMCIFVLEESLIRGADPTAPKRAVQELAVLDLEKKTPRMGTPTHDRDMDSSVHSIRSTPELTPRMAAAIFSHQGNAGPTRNAAAAILAEHAGQLSARTSKGESDMSDHDVELQPLVADDSPRLQTRPWFKEPQVIIALILCTANAGLFNYLDELRPIFAAAPILAGGLGLPTSALAVPLVAGGITFIVASMGGVEKLQNRLGSRGIARLGNALFVPTAMMSVLPSVFPHSKVAVLLTLCLAFCMNAVADITSFVGTNLLVNEAAPSEALGAVIGLSTMLNGGVRSIGPALSGVSWGVALWTGWPGHQMLPFVSCCCLALVMVWGYRFVRT